MDLLFSKSLIHFYISKGYFEDGECRLPGDEVTHVPEDDEVVVFRDFFVAGMRFPLYLLLPKILLSYNVKLHHLTPNAIVQLTKFFCAVRTFRRQYLLMPFVVYLSCICKGGKLASKVKMSFMNLKVDVVLSCHVAARRRLV